jgi:predicted dehydrogenase
VEDMVAGNMLFENGIAFSGAWCFNAAAGLEKDYCEIIGSAGKICFSIFEGLTISLITGGKTETFTFEPLPHVQQPMIEKVVEYFLDEGPNPCSGWDGVEVMKLLDAFTEKNVKYDL